MGMVCWSCCSLFLFFKLNVVMDNNFLKELEAFQEKQIDQLAKTKQTYYVFIIVYCALSIILFILDLMLYFGKTTLW